MEKIKDLIYEYSDTVLGFVIVFVMVSVIGWQLYNWFDPSDGFKSYYDKSAAASSVSDNEVSEDSSDEPASKDKSSENASDDSGNANESNVKEDSQNPPDDGKKTAGEVTFQIKQGSSCEQIAIALESTGLIDSKESFLEEIISRQLENKLKTGTYTIAKNESMESVISILTK